MRIIALLLLGLAPLSQAGSADYFTPSHRVSGIGAGRDDISEELLAARANLMIESQTFSILRDPRALPGAKRITSDPKLKPIFRAASGASGLPATLIEAIAYLESWGDARAESPSGPKGIMQISEGTARLMGLRVSRATRYRKTREKVLVATRNGKPRYRTVVRKTPYTVVSRDDRMVPGRAIPAAAKYLAGMERRFGSRDWAIFAYHCGQGCAAEMQELTRRVRGVHEDQATVARMFFSASPAQNRELYQAIQQQMRRDYSPTYYFRVRRAEQLLALYRREPAEFASLAQEYRTEITASARAPHRLSVWLRRDDLTFRTTQDIRLDAGRRLARALNKPEYLGYSLRLAEGSPNPDYPAMASPAALGTLAYIAFETRRLHEKMNPRGEDFQPLPVTALLRPDSGRQPEGGDALSHYSGYVFDIDYSGLPPGELECLRFVLDDLGWAGYLGFIEEGRDNLHIGCSPAARSFFAGIFQESLAAESTE